MTFKAITHSLVQGGTQPQKTAFPLEFSDKNCTTDRVRQIMHMCKKLKKVCRLKMAAILLIFFSREKLRDTTKIKNKQINKQATTTTLSRRRISTKFGQK